MSEYNYTIRLVDIVQQIWRDGHPDEIPDIYDIPSWTDAIGDIDEKIAYAIPKIFNFSFPCYGDDEDKTALEKHIIRKYFTREICCSSITRWQLFLYAKLHDIMPKYNAMYDANLKLIDDAINVLNPYHIEESKNRTIDTTRADSMKSDGTSSQSNDGSVTTANTGKTVGSENNTAKTQTKYSDTPQALMQTGKDYLTNLTEVNAEGTEDYTTDTTMDEDVTTKQKVDTSTNATSSTSGNENKKDDYVKTIKGNMSKYNQGELVNSYYNAIIAIEELITDDLADLFYQLY